MKTKVMLFILAVWILAPATSFAEQSSESSDLPFGLAITLGERIYFIDSEVYRGPVSLELVPSLSWAWVRLEAGLSTTLESIRIAGLNIGHWNFTFRPGASLVPPMLPVYLRLAFPLVFQTDDVDWGVMFGIGSEFSVTEHLGILIEVDTTLSNNLEWGGIGVPLEFRAGVIIHL